MYLVIRHIFGVTHDQAVQKYDGGGLLPRFNVLLKTFESHKKNILFSNKAVEVMLINDN